MARIVVGLEADADESAVVRRIERLLGPADQVVPQFPGVLLVVANDAGLVGALAELPGVRYAEPDEPYQAFDGA